MRPAANDIERRYITLASLDWYFERYGWDYDTYLDTPQWVIDDLPRVVQAKIEGARQKDENASRQAKIRASQAQAGARYGGA